MPDDARARLDALVRQIEQDAFQRGWDAAVKHIMSVAANAPRDATLPTASTKPSASVSQPRKTGYGVVPALVRELLDEADERGIRPAEVVRRGRERGEEIAESSVRQRLRKMKIAGEARNERGRWFRARTPQASREQAGGVAAPPDDELELDGRGFHAAA